MGTQPTLIMLVSALVVALCGTLQADTKGLVAHYILGKSTGTTIQDLSGHGNDGTIHGAVPTIAGNRPALQFDGQDDFVDCGTSVDLDAAGKGTVFVWARPREVQGGLVSWIDFEKNRPRLMLAIDTYHGGTRQFVYMGDDSFERSHPGLWSLPSDTWTCAAFSFDGKTVRMYQDGVLRSTVPQNVQPKTSGARLFIGRTTALGQSYFDGAIDEVRIYSRVLTPDEIVALYKQNAAAHSKDLTLLRRPNLTAQLYAAPSKLVATVDLAAMQPLPKGTILKVEIPPLPQVEIDDLNHEEPAQAILDFGELPIGQYALKATVVDSASNIVGEPSTVNVNWQGRPAAYKNLRILNNLVWELASARDVDLEKGIVRLPFSLPVDRWVIIQSKGADVRIAIDGEGEPAIVSPASEAMRYLKAGEHQLRISGKGLLQKLDIRAIPALHHAMYGGDPYLDPEGPFDWNFLSKSILPNINTMVAGLDYYRRADAFERLKEWHAKGKQWVAYKALPWELQSGDEVVKYFSESSGFKHPLTAGIMIDEANGGDLEIYDHLTDAVTRMHAQPQFRGKAMFPWCDALYAGDRSTRFARACLDNGGWLIFERYFSEESTIEQLRRVMHRYLVLEMPKWEKVFPGVTSRMVVSLSTSSEPPENVAYNPSVDYKVCMEEQVRLLATHPAFFGLGGIQWYHSGYSGEEQLRWYGRLYRHYAIDGDTNQLDTDPYALKHLKNPDFADGTNGWTVDPADAQSMAVKTIKHYGNLIQGRFVGIPEQPVRDTGMGDTFLWTKRSDTKPNRFTQRIVNLTPGRLYSLKTLSADYQDFVNEKDNKQPHAISIDIDGVDVLAGPKNNFRFPVPQARPWKSFNWNGKRFWSVYHRRVFTAKSDTATLTVSDWKDRENPGGPAGQELIFNFFELQPYLGDSAEVTSAEPSLRKYNASTVRSP